MKTKYLLFITLLFAFNQSSAQLQLGKIVKEYYRVDPFSGNFSSFIKALSTDPELLNKKEIQKSDTSNYFLKGNYKVFNPFSINAHKVEMVFTEQKIDIQLRSRQYTQTVYTYQILGYFNDTEPNRKSVIKDYNKIKKRLKKDFGIEVAELRGVQNIEDGEIANFFLNNSVVYPVTLSWQTLSKSKYLALTMILKLVVSNNYAVPAAGYSYNYELKQPFITGQSF